MYITNSQVKQKHKYLLISSGYYHFVIRSTIKMFVCLGLSIDNPKIKNDYSEKKAERAQRGTVQVLTNLDNDVISVRCGISLSF